jgi:hypothetical protein
MTSLEEPHLRQALHDLATLPAPTDLSDQVLRRARRVRTGRVAGVGVLVLAGLLAVPFVASLRAGPGGAAQPGGAPLAGAPVAATCTPAPSVAKDVKRVAPENWPEFVRITVAALPPRTDYEMQSGYDLCVPEPLEGSSGPAGVSAYAVINLGPAREHGHLTVDLYRWADARIVAVTCAALATMLATPNVDGPALPNQKQLFCTDGTATTPTVYGLSWDGEVTVVAVYADARAVRLESHSTWTGSAFTPPEISADALRPVVTSPALANLLA